MAMSVKDMARDLYQRTAQSIPRPGKFKVVEL